MHLLKNYYLLPLKKGTVFWYRVKNLLFGAIVIEVQNDSDNNLYFLILISEQLCCVPTDINVILDTKSYTLAWFDEYSLLVPARVHIVDNISINGNYYNKFGILIKTDGTFLCNNNGQLATWKHEFSSYSFHNEQMREVLFLQHSYCL